MQRTFTFIKVNCEEWDVWSFKFYRGNLLEHVSLERGGGNNKNVPD